jgi:hypothetical protein
VTDSAAASIEAKLAELSARIDALAAEREQYRDLYVQTLEVCRKLELGIIGQKRERLSPGDAQLTMGMLSMLVGRDGRGTAPADAPPASGAGEETKVAAHTRAKPTVRKPLPESLPRVEVEVLPPEVQRRGLDAFERIGEDVTETVERRQASFVVVRTQAQVRRQGPRAKR